MSVELLRQREFSNWLDAYAQLHPEVRSQVGLVFVGDGDARIELTTRGSKVCPGKVQFSGFVHRERLPEFYALADALVFPTHSDTWGLVVNEAMSCGLPVVATSVAGCVADLVEDGWNGFVVPPWIRRPNGGRNDATGVNIDLRSQNGLQQLAAGAGVLS